MKKQLILALEARNIDPGATENQRLSIVRRRDRLKSQVNGFMEAAERFLGHELDIGFLQPIHDEIDDDIGDPFHSPSSEDAESTVLPLPSYIGVNNCHHKGLQHLVDQELQLWQGQANDALHEI